MNIFILKIYFETIFLELDFKIEQALDLPKDKPCIVNDII